MSERFVCADPHFGHKGMIQFARRDRVTPLRPWGRVVTQAEPMDDREAQDRVEAMDEALVANWNRVVQKGDKVELLGDVVINRRALSILDRLNGKKRLRMGNHDIFLKDYGKYFQEISAYKVMDDLIMSHIPLQTDSVKQRWKANVHGHLHEGDVMLPYLSELGTAGWQEVPHPRYLCVSMEHISYTPLPLDAVYQRIESRRAMAELVGAI